jgi:hypothetical protein
MLVLVVRRLNAMQRDGDASLYLLVESEKQ